jgi:cob(I)alamin adenosyltransferase
MTSTCFHLLAGSVACQATALSSHLQSLNRPLASHTDNSPYNPQNPMHIYTRTGDDGTTGLFGGGRISKADLRIDTYGTVDEVNAAIGLAAVTAPITVPILRSISSRLVPIQHELFVIGAHLASAPGNPHADKLPPLPHEAAARLETEIDEAEGVLAPLKQFILPGGSELAARLHLARTICRRAERLAVELNRVEGGQSVPEVVLVYLNRLSDWLFVQARLANHLLGVDDVPWIKA